MRGCAEGIELGGVASGPVIGKPSADGEYAAHELAHTLGRHHPQSLCGDWDNPNTSPDPGWPSDIEKTAIGSEVKPDVGFDAGDPVTGEEMRTMPWGRTADIMTYCEQELQWPSAYTYSGICRRLAEENHSTDYSACQIAGEPLVAGAETRELNPETASATGLVRSPENIAFAEGTNQDALVLIGSVNLTANTGVFAEPVKVKREARPVGKRDMGATELELQSFNANGMLLSKEPALLHPNSERSPNAPLSGNFSGEIPYDPSISHIDLMWKGRVIARRQGPIQPPDVDIAAPKPQRAAASGCNSGYCGWRGLTKQLEYRWSTKNNAPAKYTVQIRTSRNENWQTVAVGLSQNSIILNPNWFEGADEVQVRVRASNGIHETVTTGIPYKLR